MWCAGRRTCRTRKSHSGRKQSESSSSSQRTSAKAREESKADKPKAKKAPQQRRANKPQAQKPAEKPVETRALNADEYIVGKLVNVNMGKGNMAATIVEINKDDVRVQLANGLQMVVKAEHLRA